jgi:formiminotetrahydrofolate cyclodeaminase
MALLSGSKFYNSQGYESALSRTDIVMPNPRISSETSIRGLYTALTAADAAQGSVVASAVSAGMGVSLLMMVAALPTTRVGSIDDRKALTRATKELLDVQRQLAATIDVEMQGRLVAAREMLQASDKQRSTRDAAIQVALRAAADVPLEVMRLSAQGLKAGQLVAGHGCRAASSDVDLAIAMLRVGLVGAQSSLELKLTSLTDATYTQAVVHEIARLSEEGTTAASAAESSLRVPPA